MTPEDKQILLKDLCDRLPYGVIIDSEKYNKAHYRKHYLQRLILVNVLCKEVICIDVDDYPDPKCRKHKLEYCKPYLRPMSDMTEEEFEDLKRRYVFCESCRDENDVMDVVNRGKIEFCDAANVLNWLNEHHLDYNGLITKGLALPAPEGMYKN